uniref:Uncharacterized protein n=1 Tax=Sphaeramia orbicularis TaxID=375764 RepID=A0A672ZFT8_9TELE
MADDLDIEAMLEAPYRKVSRPQCILMMVLSSLWCSNNHNKNRNVKLKPEHNILKRDSVDAQFCNLWHLTDDYSTDGIKISPSLGLVLVTAHCCFSSIMHLVTS